MLEEESDPLLTRHRVTASHPTLVVSDVATTRGSLALAWLSVSNLRLTTDDVRVDERDNARRAFLSVVLVIAVVIALALGGLYWLRETLRVDHPGVAQVVEAPGNPPEPYDVCKQAGLTRLARQLSTPANADAVSLAWAGKYSNRNPDVRQGAIDGCRQGLESG